MRHLVLFLIGLNSFSSLLLAQTASPYTTAIAHEIKSLSPADMDDLRVGRGMGLAKPAELNGYPGPMHVLELAAQLDLSADQRAMTEAIIARMRAAAIALGTQIIAAEHDLDRAFADAAIEPASLQTGTAEIAALYGALRAVHLSAHLDQRALLTPGQQQRYMVLRGYAAAATGPHRHPHR